MASASNPPAPLLSVPEKKTTHSELFRDRHFFNSDTFTTIRDTRKSIQKHLDTHAPESSPSILTARLKLYLHYIKTLTSSRQNPCDYDDNLSFTWQDAFRPGKRATIKTILFEKASIWFNIGAVFSRIAVGVDRHIEGGSKKAAAEFQRAAGGFAIVGEIAREAGGGVGSWTADAVPECAAMLEMIMLAQAQECVYERAVAAGSLPGSCSKVARQASIYYEDAYAALMAPPLVNQFDRSWVSHIQLKAAQFFAEACYKNAMVLHEDLEIGQEIARLKVGISAIDDAKRTARGAPAALYNTISRLEHDMNQTLEKAVTENNRLYLIRIPPADSLDPLPTASLVHSASMNAILDAIEDSNSHTS